MKRFFAGWLMGLPVYFLNAWLIKLFWAWFLVPSTHFAEIGYIEALGIMSLVALLVQNPGRAESSEARWNLFLALFEAVIPSDRKLEVEQAVANFANDDTMRAVKFVMSQLTGSATALLLGFVLHLFV